MKKGFFLFALLLVLLPLPLLAGEFYFNAQTGDDANSGSSGSPLKTLSALEKMSLSPGDKIIISGKEVICTPISFVNPRTGETILTSNYPGSAHYDLPSKKATLQLGQLLIKGTAVNTTTGREITVEEVIR